MSGDRNMQISKVRGKRCCSMHTSLSHACITMPSYLSYFLIVHVTSMADRRCGRRDVHGAPVGLLRVHSRAVFSWQDQMVLCVHGKKVAQAIRGWTCKHPYLLSRTSFGVSLEESKAIGALFHGLCAVRCAHSAGGRVGTCAGHFRSSTEVSGC
jgi:hypothetical protein